MLFYLYSITYQKGNRKSFFLPILTVFDEIFNHFPGNDQSDTDGTNATLPGIARRSVHLCFAPGGQIQFERQLIAISSTGLIGSSLKVDLVWALADFFNGLMAVPNLLALLALSGVVAGIARNKKD